MSFVLLLFHFASSVLLCYVVKVIYNTIFRRSPFYSIPGPPSESWFKGNLGQLFNAKGLPFHQDLVDRYGGMVKVHGFFGDEQLYISDPQALQSIILKDQDAFEETSVFVQWNKIIFGPGLVSTVGQQHKRQRKLVTPVFSVAQLRQLTPIIYDVAERLSGVLTRETAESESRAQSVLDMSEWMSRVALETVGQTILGYSFDPLDSPHNNPYTSAVKELIPAIFSLSLIRQFAPFMTSIGSASFRRKVVELIPHQAVQRVKHMSDVMHETATEILRQKRETLALAPAETSQAKDVISILLRANDKASHDEKMSELELTGQMTVLIFGAQDTTSSALSRMLYMLAAHPDVQSSVRQEVRDALRAKRREGDYSGRLGYDDVVALPWLDAVIKETLRLHPPVPFVRRTAVKERTVLYHPAHDESQLSSVMIPAGTTLFVSIAGSNRLESVWGSDAKEWRPQRWLEGDPLAALDTRWRLPGVYSGMMSFLGGGRSCVGYKFAQVEMKILLATLLNKFEFSSTEDSVVWNLSQIISPSVQTTKSTELGTVLEEKKGMPLRVRLCAEETF